VSATPVRRLRVPDRYDFAGTLAPLRPLRRDPAVRLSAGDLWWAARTPDGPGTLHLRHEGGEVHATGYGAGGPWQVERADALAGLRDDVTGFEPLAAANPVVRRAWHLRAGRRMTRSGRLFAMLVPVVLGQKVTGKEAAQSFVRLAHHFGEAAPGPVAGLLLPPDPQQIAASPYWLFHPFGVEQRRADTLRRVAAAAQRLEGAPDAAAATAALTALPGIGAWTAAEAVRIAYGDPDLVSTGDYNLPHAVVFALTGAPRAGSRESAPGRLSPADERMMALLEPFRGHRARVCDLLLAAGPHPPRFGPRHPLRSFARF
jgi:3-methyladenine DNA glycosylase/8-oxoguanine DNA glycosylase